MNVLEIFPTESPQKAKKSVHAPESELYTEITDQLLNVFYPKECCGEKLTKTDGKRDLMLRCPKCHRQQSRLVGTPLHHLKLPRWMFGLVLREMVVQHPNVVTTAQIERRLGITPDSAIRLKRRIQVFASTQLERMQERLYEVLAQTFEGFDLPKDTEADLSELSREVPIPQADTVVLYSCSQRANKGRKRYKRKGQTSSIYRSESLGGEQMGTLVNTFGIRQGPAFFDSISDQRMNTLNPLIRKYMPHNTPIFTDMGYRAFTGKNHRMVNHNARSKDKRYKFARNRWSKNGVHCNVAEGLNALVKQSFTAYRWINPKYSQLYLNEFAFIRNLKHFDILELIKEKQEAKTARNQGRGQEQRPKATANQGPSKKPKASASERAPAVRGLKKGMYSRGDLNPHAVKHTHLKRTCLPIPPPERVFCLKAACAAFRQN